MNVDMLMAEANDLYFARHSEADTATMQEIQADLVRYVAKVDRLDLKAGIRRALIHTASK